MRVLLDIDGTCVDLVTRWLSLYRQATVKRDIVYPDDLNDYNIISQVKYPDILVQCINDYGLFYTLPFIKDAKKYIEFLIQEHDVSFCTYAMTSKAASEKMNWVKEHFGETDIIICKEKWRIDADLIIDDNPEIHDKTSYRSIGLRHSYNTKREDLELYDTWEDIYKSI